MGQALGDSGGGTGLKSSEARLGVCPDRCDCGYYRVQGYVSILLPTHHHTCCSQEPPILPRSHHFPFPPRAQELRFLPVSAMNGVL